MNFFEYIPVVNGILIASVIGMIFDPSREIFILFFGSSFLRIIIIQTWIDVIDLKEAQKGGGEDAKRKYKRYNKKDEP